MALSTILFVAVSCLTLVRTEVTVIDTHRENSTLTSFADMPAGFGDDFPEQGLEGYLVYSDPPTACSQLKNPAPKDKKEYKWILLILRGGGNHCQFADKVLNAQLNNYDAAIVFDDKQENRLPIMRGGSNGTLVHIPSTFIGMTSGQILAHDFTYKAGGGRYILNIIDDPQFDYKMYLWPFAIVVAVCFLMVMVFLIIKFIREHARQRLSRLSTKHLKKIPVRKYKKGDYYDTCAICLDEYEENEKIRVLPCDHVYHTKCIDPWLTKNKKTCPVCKRRVIPGKDADSEDSDSDGGSERRPLLAPGSSGRGQSPYGAQAPSAAVQVHDETEEAQATGGVGISEVPPPRAAEEDKPDSANEKRRRRMDRERRQLVQTLNPETGGDEGQATFPEKVAQALEKDETREERRERKKKKKDSKKKKRASRTDVAPPSAEGTDVVAPELLDSVERPRRATTFDEDEEFMSCRSSFRDVDGASTSAQIEQEEEERQRELEKEREGYVNASYSDSGEIVVPPGRRELSEVV